MRHAPATAWTVLAALLAVGGSGCRDEGGEETARATPALTVVVRDSAATAAREAGIDLGGLARRSAARALAALPDTGRPVRIELKVDSGNWLVIPELGLGGTADTGTEADVLVALERPLRDGTNRWLPAVLAHELHHVVRCRLLRPCGGTLGAALVLEGLADHFAQEVFPETPPFPWDTALTRAWEASLWNRAQPELWERAGYDRAAWFFGGRGIPRWAGYTLGHRIVGAYLRGGRTAAGSASVDARAVSEAYTRGG